ncbi:hypothetical protein BGZ67_000474 [Mortierella alpina]|nr:hypothetical protein BGZ67_000474 [Mortierella alpina]
MSNGHGNVVPGGMAVASIDDAALRAEKFQEHQLRLQEKYRLQHQNLDQMDAQGNGAHPHDPAPNDSEQPYYTSQGQLIYPTPSPCYQARPQYGLSDFQLLETLGKTKTATELLADARTQHPT